MRVHTCAHPGCGVRLILAKPVPPLKRFPPLNAVTDPLGTAAAFQDAHGTWHGRFLAAADPEPVAPEKRYGIHECEGSRHAAQRAQVKAAQTALAKAQRNQRGHRPGPQVTGYVVQPPTLPGMDQSGRNT
jgi:hypothetical protein